jgi:choline dehydrogenase-like flavoprotein
LALGRAGGTVASRLAEAGMKVLLLEAGADPAAPRGRASRLSEDYDVQAFPAFASENKAMAWNLMVHDFGDDAKRRSRPRGRSAAWRLISARIDARRLHCTQRDDIHGSA